MSDDNKQAVSLIEELREENALLEQHLETALDELAEWETRATYWYKEATSRGKGGAHVGA